MKTHFIFFCFVISNLMANATTQTSLNQDKPTRLYVKSYNIGNIGTEVVSNGLPWNNQISEYNENMDWKDGVAGSYNYESKLHEYNRGIIWGALHEAGQVWYSDEYQEWQPCSWPRVDCSENDTGYSYYYSDLFGPYTNFTGIYNNTYTNTAKNTYQEHCDASYSGYIPPDYWGTSSQIDYRRSAETTMHLQTGGKANAKLKRLFGITATVTQNNPTNYSWDLTPGNEGTGFYSTNIPSTNIMVLSTNLNKNGKLYAVLYDNDDVDITPTVLNMDYYNFSVAQSEVKTKADWQQVVQYEIDSDSGVKIENYAASSGFMTNRANIQAVYAFYQKIFTEQPTEFYWAGLAKLAGAPVYAGLSDAQNVLYSTTNMSSSGGNGTNVAAVTNFVNSFQQTLIGMNIAIMNDLAWQFEAYRKCGLNAIQTAYVIDATVLDTNAIAAWQQIDQGIQQNIITNVQAGNKVLLQREQQQVLTGGYLQLNTLSPIVTWGMSQFAENPVPGGTDFITMEPGGNIGDFNARWDWINHPTTGMWWLWLGTSSSTQLSWVQIPLTTRAANYAQFTPVY